jgi:segregation and condensation protein B
MESSKDLPGIKELRDAGLLDNRPPPGSMTESNINDFIEDDDQEDMFE